MPVDHGHIVALGPRWSKLDDALTALGLCRVTLSLVAVNVSECCVVIPPLAAPS